MPLTVSLRIKSAKIACAAAMLTVGLSASPPPAKSTYYTGIPSLWSPPKISTENHESTPTFTPDGQLMLFVLSDQNFAKSRIMQSRCEAGGWSRPTPAPFTKPLPAVESDPFVAHDGRKSFFISSRVSQGAPSKGDFDIFSVERLRNGKWGEPSRLPEPVNSDESEFLPRTDRHGNLYFRSDRPGGLGLGDIYVGTQDDKGKWRVRNVGAPINTAGNEVEAEISEDGRTMIVTAERPAPAHLFRYQLKSGRWIEAGRIPAKPDVYQVGPLISPKSDRLLFAQKNGNQSGEIFLVDLKPKPDISWPPKCG